MREVGKSLRRDFPPTAWIPLAMSLVALAIVLGHIAMFGTAREADEGAAAHLWQLLMAGQPPLFAVFTVTNPPRRSCPTLPVLGAQGPAMVAAAPPAFFLG